MYIYIYLKYKKKMTYSHKILVTFFLSSENWSLYVYIYICMYTLEVPQSTINKITIFVSWEFESSKIRGCYQSV